MKTVCLGPMGTFSEMAAQKFINSQSKGGSLLFADTFDGCIQILLSGEADLAVVPVENSIEGAVNPILDHLIFNENLYIKKQFHLSITHNLMINRGDSSEISVIMSHPQALAQCNSFIRANYPAAKIAPVSSTAEAAKTISQEKKPGQAAIANSYSAEVYGLTVIRENIAGEENRTSFIVIGREPDFDILPGSVTSLAFSTRHKPGELYRILDIFSLWDINIIKIVSRPMKKKPGEYVFCMDLEAGHNPKDLSDALIMVQRKTDFYKNLGNYFSEEI